MASSVDCLAGVCWVEIPSCHLKFGATSLLQAHVVHGSGVEIYGVVYCMLHFNAYYRSILAYWQDLLGTKTHVATVLHFSKVVTSPAYTLALTTA